MRRIVLLLPLLIAAGAARADTAPTAAKITPYRLQAPAPPRAPPSVRLRSPLEAAVLPPGVARTSVDHRFEREGLVGSAGFLCGLQPGLDKGGAAGINGFDPHGRFVGAKLSLAF